MYSIARLAEILSKTRLVKAQLIEPEFWVKFLAYDSRKLGVPSQSVFLAINSGKNNGHKYIPQLVESGFKAFIVTEEHWLTRYPELNFLLVDDTVSALQDIAAKHRKNSKATVAAITGSNGKTIVKEWVAELMAGFTHLLVSPKSFNSQLGVPLSVWQLKDYHTLAMFEAGISTTGEMDSLAAVIEPEIGILTNIGSAHDSGFISRVEKLHEKLKLFANSKVLIYLPDGGLIDEHIGAFAKANKVELLPISINKHLIYDNGSSVSINFKGNNHRFELPFADKISVENAITAAAFCLHCGMNEVSVQEKIGNLKTTSYRLEVKPGINDTTLIDDSYTNDLVALSSAIDFAISHKKPADHNLSLILSSFEDGTEESLGSVAEIVNKAGIKTLVGVSRGGEFNGLQELLSPDIKSFFFSSTDSLIDGLATLPIYEGITLIKGARSFGFERIVQQLEEKTTGTRLEINLDALVSNFNFYRSKLSAGVKTMVMVKAYAYGSGSYQTAKLLEYHQADYLAVAYPDEGIDLRKNGINLPIMVMNASPETYRKLSEFQLEPVLYNRSGLEAWLKLSEFEVKPPSVHIELETGMHRLGLQDADVEFLLRQIAEGKKIKLASVFSHLSSSDDKAQQEYTRNQAEKFRQLSQKLIDAVHYKVLRHLCNSAGIISYPEYHFDMVRLGIGIYGIEVSGSAQAELQVVGVLKSNISQIHLADSGDTVGYNRRYVAERRTRVATVALGYADGFMRALGNGKSGFKINGRFAPVLGSVCMDMTMVDVTDIDCKEGEEVVVFDSAEDLFSLAKAAGTIPYEIMTAIGQRVKRVFISA